MIDRYVQYQAKRDSLSITQKDKVLNSLKMNKLHIIFGSLRGFSVAKDKLLKIHQ